LYNVKQFKEFIVFLFLDLLKIEHFLQHMPSKSNTRL